MFTLASDFLSTPRPVGLTCSCSHARRQSVSLITVVCSHTSLQSGSSRWTIANHSVVGGETITDCCIIGNIHTIANNGDCYFFHLYNLALIQSTLHPFHFYCQHRSSILHQTAGNQIHMSTRQWFPLFSVSYQDDSRCHHSQFDGHCRWLLQSCNHTNYTVIMFHRPEQVGLVLQLPLASQVTVADPDIWYLSLLHM